MEDNSSGSPLQRMASITNALVSQPSQVHTSYLRMMMVGLTVMMVMTNMVMKMIMMISVIVMTMIQVNFGTPNRPNLKNVLPPITQQQVFVI